MAQTRDGALKIAAKRIGLTEAEYRAQVTAGLKWCTKAKHWEPRDNFTAERSRGDGLSAACATCRLRGTKSGPSVRERRMHLTAGERWCRGCRDWLPSSKVSGGVCRIHAAAEERQRYATHPKYRAERRQHAHARKRGVAPIPVEAQQMILDDFGGVCAYCPSPATTWDHIVPISQGGRTTPGNMVPACSPCNSSKHGAEVFAWAAATGRTVSEAFVERYQLAFVGLFG